MAKKTRKYTFKKPLPKSFPEPDTLESVLEPVKQALPEQVQPLPQTPFKCDFCNLVFTDSSNKRRHMNKSCKVRKQQIATGLIPNIKIPLIPHVSGKHKSPNDEIQDETQAEILMGYRYLNSSTDDIVQDVLKMIHYDPAKLDIANKMVSTPYADQSKVQIVKKQLWEALGNHSDECNKVKLGKDEPIESAKSIIQVKSESMPEKPLVTPETLAPEALAPGKPPVPPEKPLVTDTFDYIQFLVRKYNNQEKALSFLKNRIYNPDIEIDIFTEIFLDGPSGDWVLICTDAKKGDFKYLNAENKWVNDLGGVEIHKRFKYNFIDAILYLSNKQIAQTMDHNVGSEEYDQLVSKLFDDFDLRRCQNRTNELLNAKVKVFTQALVKAMEKKR